LAGIAAFVERDAEDRCDRPNQVGADIVEYPLDARAGRVVLHVSFASLNEVEYIAIQERSQADATAALAKMRGWPVQWHHTDDVLCSEAAKLKAAHKISFADAFVAATALRLGATLVHKDPDFNALDGIIKLHPLPPKTGAVS
jgi:predicted nucleic acid-binding protein